MNIEQQVFDSEAETASTAVLNQQEYAELRRDFQDFVDRYSTRKLSEGDDLFTGLVEVTTSIRRQAQHLNDLALTVLIGGSIAVTISILLGILLSRAIANPIKRLTEVVSAMGIVPTEQITDLGITSKDEVGQLARSFDKMTRNLRERTEELEETKNGLEYEIVERKQAEAAVRQANLNLEELNQTLEEANAGLVKAQDQLVRSEKLAAIGQLAGSVAHDLRNPLGAISNAVYYLNRKLAGSEAAQTDQRIPQFLQIMEQEVGHSNQIITDLMTFARVNAPSLAPTNLAEVIDNTLSRVAPKADVRIATRLDPDLPAVLADGEQLQRVFMNLANNAQDAMPQGGELTITTQRMDGFAQVIFSDSGIGITQEDLKKVFDPLFTTKSKGTGLGLAVCQEIVSKHGGAIAGLDYVVSTVAKDVHQELSDVRFIFNNKYLRHYGIPTGVLIRSPAVGMTRLPPGVHRKRP